MDFQNFKNLCTPNSISNPANPTIGKNHKTNALRDSSEFFFMNLFLSKVAVSIRQSTRFETNAKTTIRNRGQPNIVVCTIPNYTDTLPKGYANSKKLLSGNAHGKPMILPEFGIVVAKLYVLAFIGV